MRIIARGTLTGFVRNRVEPKLARTVKSHLDRWYAEAVRASWNSSAEVKQVFRSASILSSERVVFNIRGNDFRLVVAINYHYHVLLIIWLGTHKEYDRIDVERIEYERDRYTDSPCPNKGRP